MYSRWRLNEFSAAYADLGTFLPLVIGLIVVAGMDPVGLFFGFGVFAVATGIFYRRPIPVQPMKAVAAAGLAGFAGPEVVVATGFLLGVTLLALGQTNVISYLKSLMPKTVLHGMRLTLAVSLVALAFGLDGIDILTVVVLSALLVALQCSVARPVSCLLIIIVGFIWLGSPPELQALSPRFSLPAFSFPNLYSLFSGLQSVFLPQLAMTLTNALILTAVLAQDYFPDQINRLNEKKFAITSGLANLCLAPFGAIPMCHGAGGLSAYYGMGARTGLAVTIFGLTCLLVGLFFGNQAVVLLFSIPSEVTATLILFAAWALADLKTLLGIRRSCQAVIALMIPLTLSGGLLAALLGGIALEYVRTKYFESAGSGA